MKKKSSATYMVYLLALLHSTHTWSMELVVPAITHNPFSTMSIELVQNIFFHCNENYYLHEDTEVRTALEKRALDTTQKTIMRLSTTCKQFQQTLDDATIGTIFEKYDYAKKQELVSVIMFSDEKTGMLGSINPTYYASKCRLIRGLLCSGAPLRNYCCDKLIFSAMHYNDLNLVAFLCNKKVIDLYKEDRDRIPLFFYARTVEMAQLCEENGINLATPGPQGCLYPNILWKTVATNSISSTLVEYLLTKNVSTQLNTLNGNCLLHALVTCLGRISNSKHTIKKEELDNILNKATLLLAQQPDLVNTLNYFKKTPLDCARNLLVTTDFFDDNDPIKDFIQLLKEHGENNQK